MKLVTAEQMRAIDQRAIQERGIPGLKLMENAGRGVAEWAREILGGEVAGKRVVVVSGKGNNGGDGYVVARYLSGWGSKVQVIVIAQRDEIKGDARANLEELRLPVIFARTAQDIPDLKSVDLIVDGIFGTGFQGEVSGLAAEAIALMNASRRPILAIDAPSGLNSDTGEVSTQCIRASFTATLALPKLGQCFFPGKAHCGRLKVIDIGLPDEVVDSFDISLSLITREYVSEVVPDREPTAHKGDAGRLFIVAGAVGLTGAATLAANAAMRAGAGLVTVGIPKSLNDILEVKLTEAMTRPLPELKKQRCLAVRALGDILIGMRASDAMCLGPGVGRNHETMDLMRRIVVKLDRPGVLDADGLCAFSGKLELLKAATAPMVLTPHPGEFTRLTGEELGSAAAERIGAVRSLANEIQKVVVLKGAPTIIADVNGQVHVNPTGNAAMATGGSGDVLTGVIGALLASGIPVFPAAVAGVYLHGLAGDLGKEEKGTFGLIAGDIVDKIAGAMKLLKR